MINLFHLFSFLFKLINKVFSTPILKVKMSSTFNPTFMETPLIFNAEFSSEPEPGLTFDGSRGVLDPRTRQALPFLSRQVIDLILAISCKNTESIKCTENTYIWKINFIQSAALTTSARSICPSRWFPAPIRVHS